MLAVRSELKLEFEMNAGDGHVESPETVENYFENSKPALCIFSTFEITDTEDNILTTS